LLPFLLPSFKYPELLGITEIKYPELLGITEIKYPAPHWFGLVGAGSLSGCK
jgi:hypothetical protein